MNFLLYFWICSLNTYVTRCALDHKLYIIHFVRETYHLNRTLFAPFTIYFLSIFACYFRFRVFYNFLLKNCDNCIRTGDALRLQVYFLSISLLQFVDWCLWMLIVADNRWLSDYTAIEIGSALSCSIFLDVCYVSVGLCVSVSVSMVPVKDVCIWIGHAAVSAGALFTYLKMLLELLALSNVTQYIENIT